MSAAEEGRQDPPKSKGKVRGGTSCLAWGLQPPRCPRPRGSGKTPVGREGWRSLRASQPPMPSPWRDPGEPRPTGLSFPVCARAAASSGLGILVAKSSLSTGQAVSAGCCADVQGHWSKGGVGLGVPGPSSRCPTPQTLSSFFGSLPGFSSARNLVASAQGSGRQSRPAASTTGAPAPEATQPQAQGEWTVVGWGPEWAQTEGAPKGTAASQTPQAA